MKFGMNVLSLEVIPLLYFLISRHHSSPAIISMIQSRKMSGTCSTHKRY